MADNVTLPTTGTGTATPVLATDDVAGVHYPIGKLAYGALDSATIVTNASGNGLPAQGDVAHDGVDAGNPLLNGARAIAHGANPTAVAAADRTVTYANRAGIPFTIGGHPNIVTAVWNATGAFTDDPVVAVIGTGTKIVVTRITIALDEATTVGVAVRMGFGSTTLPALGASGADGVSGLLFYHPGLVPGGGIQIGDGSAILGIGGDGEDLRVTCEAPTSGTLAIGVSYFTIES